MSQKSVVLFISPESYLYACEVFGDFYTNMLCLYLY